MQPRLALTILAAGSLAAASLWIWTTSAAESDSAAGLDRLATLGALQASIPDLEGGVAEPRTGAGASRSEMLRGPARGDLLERLRRVSAAHGGKDRRALEDELQALLQDPALVLAVLDWLTTPEALDEVDASRGALVLIEAALALYDSGDTRFGTRGEELVYALLETLPRLDRTLLGSLVRVVARARSARGYVLDMRFLAEIVRLRREHPERADELAGLFAHLDEALGSEAQAKSFRQLFLEGQEDPLLVKLALGSLLEQAPDTFLPLAEALLQGRPDDARLRAAVLQAIATSAPVTDAVRSLSRLAGETHYEQFSVLASRPGSLAELEDEYGALLVSQLNPLGRKMLVSAMRAEKEEVLLGIARTDPAPQVKLQALLTLTVRGPVGQGVLDELRALRPAPGNVGRSGVTNEGLVLAAENVLLHSSGRVREDARDLLVEIVRDRSASDADRLNAYQRVRIHAAPDAFFGVVIDGRPLR